MELRQYETVFILTPVLSDEQIKDTVEKFRQILKEGETEIVHEEDWGLRKLAYPIDKKTTGYYTLIEFKARPDFVKKLDVEYKRDERVIRHLVLALDKYAVAYNQKRREKLSNQTQPQEQEQEN